MKPASWPRYMVEKRIASGLVSYYWSPQRRDVANGCPVRAEALGPDYGVAVACFALAGPVGKPLPDRRRAPRMEGDCAPISGPVSHSEPCCPPRAHPLNPFVGVERVYGHGTTGPASRHQALALANALARLGHPSLGAAALICFEWLQRPETVLAGHLAWTDYRPPHRPRHVRIDHHKTGKKIWQPLEDNAGCLYPELEDFLSRLPRLGIPIVLLEPQRAPRTPRPYSLEHARHLVQRARKLADLPAHVTLAACRHGGMTELGDAGLTEAQVMALSAHETPDAARLYVKRTEVQRATAARARRIWLDAQAQHEQILAKKSE